MVLFVVMALLAAYANRSLMFEQRIASSYFRVSVAQEMTEGSIDWTVAMLNSTAIDGNCTPVANGQRFVDRYLQVNPVDRVISQNSVSYTDFVADCARTDQGLTCRCPAAPSAAVPVTRTVQPTQTVADQIVPSFGVKIWLNNTPGAFLVRNRGCTGSSIDGCATTSAVSSGVQGVAQQDVKIGLISAVRSPPATPLTVKGTLAATGAGGLGLHNTDPRTAGMLLVSGGADPLTLTEDRMDSLPGTPAVQARLFNDSQIGGSATKDDVFRLFMGIAPARHANHPAMRVLDCSTGDCTGRLQAAYAAGARMLLVKGPLGLNTGATIASPSDPLLLIVNGDATLRGSFQFNGMLVVRDNLDWANTSAFAAPLVTGAVLVLGDMQASGRLDIQYLQTVADQLRNRMGSYARISGGWMDTN
jgi:hypothetical protein